MYEVATRLLSTLYNPNYVDRSRLLHNSDHVSNNASSLLAASGRREAGSC